MNTNIIYVGHADHNNATMEKAWAVFSASDEGRASAIQQGYTAASIMSFSKEYKKGEPEPLRFGDLVIDFDNKENAHRAIEVGRQFLMKMNKIYGLDLYHLRYWMSGNKGCHIAIPAKLFSGDAGDVNLPKIHKTMLQFICLRCFHRLAEEIKNIDMSLYCMGKGKLLRIENIQRPNGRYKVPVTAEEFFHKEISTLEKFTYSPRQIEINQVDDFQPCQELAELFFTSKTIVDMSLTDNGILKKVDAVFGCEFIQHCYQEQENLPEPYWYAMICNLATLGVLGKQLIHEFSRGYPEYDFADTEKKIEHAIDANAPSSCNYIHDTLQFKCSKDCEVGCPAAKWKTASRMEYISRSKFELQEDGLYYRISDGAPAYKVCSWIKVLTKAKNPDGDNWGRLIEIMSPDGQRKKIFIPMRLRSGKMDQITQKLFDAGLELENFPKAASLLMEYIQNGADNSNFGTVTDRNGWLPDNRYVLGDKTFGNTKNEEVFFLQDTNKLFQEKGSLSEWQENVGKLCCGNSLLVFCTSYAFMGPLLKHLDMESGGMHLYGVSSQGKSTVATVAGSVCGGGGDRGFLRAWRATHNALEMVASMHNDFLLVLDEVGQASSDTINQIGYMLAHGQGRQRMTSEIMLRKTFEWRLNFLSTGEMSFVDKIEENQKYTAHAGQEVRVLDIPVDAEKGINPFTALHGISDPGTFSDHLKKNACRFYGTPIRAFLEKLCASLQETTERLQSEIHSYFELWRPEGASGQVERALKKFVAIGVVGELTREWGILPYNPGEALEAAKEWFNVWLKVRNCVGDREIQKVIEKLIEHFESSGYLYIDRANAQYDNTSRYGIPGYKIATNPDEYLVLEKTLKDIIPKYLRAAVEKRLIELGAVKITGNGRIAETGSICGKTVRGLTIIPQKLNK